MDNSVASERFARGSAIPIGWHKARFGDIARNVRVAVDRNNCKLDRYVAGEHIETNNLRIKKWGAIGEDYLGPAFNHRFARGNVLYGSRRTYLRKVAVAGFDGICANTTFVIEPKGSDLIPELLPYVIQSDSFTEHSIRMSKGSVNPYVNWKDIACYEFMIPPIDEQRRIARILLAAEDCTVKIEQLFEEMGILRKIIMKKLLNRGLKHTHFKYVEELRSEVPEEWEVVKVSDLLSLEYGTGLPEKERTGKGYPVYGSSGIVGYHNEYLLDGTGIVVGRKGTAGSVHLTRASFWPIDTAYYVKTREDLNIFWVYFLLSALDLHKLHSSTAVPGLNRNDVYNLRVPLPPLSEQKAIAEILLRIDEIVERILASIDVTNSLRMKLINRLLTEGVST